MKAFNAIPACLAAAFMCSSPASSFAGVIVSLNNPGSTTLHEIEVMPGSTFSVDVIVEPQYTMAWMTFQLAASSPSVFDLTGGAFVSPWNSAAAPITVGPLTPISPTLYASVPTNASPQPIASPLGNLTLSVDPAIQPGTYTLNAASIFWKPSWISLDMPRQGASGTAFVVHVVPEPASLIMLLGLALCWPLHKR